MGGLAHCPQKAVPPPWSHIDAQGAVIVETLEGWGTFDTEACRDKAVHQTFQIGACSSPSAWLTTPACAEVMEKDASLWSNEN